MMKVNNGNRRDSLRPAWFLLSLYLLIPLSNISISIFHSYQLKEILNNGIGSPSISEEGLGTIGKLNFLGWLHLLFLFILLLFIIPEIRKGLKHRRFILRKLDHAEAANEEKIKQLEEINSFVRDLYDQAPIGFHSSDPNGVILEMNQTELDWLGYTREEVVGKMKSSDLLAHQLQIKDEEKRVQAEEKCLEQFIKKGFLYNVESVFQKKTGEQFPVLVNSKAVFDVEGNYIHSRTAVFDFTERKQMEEAVEQKRDELDRLGLLKSQFIANMSHEVRTPLNAILGFSNLLDRTPLNEDQLEFVKGIKSSGENLLAIINDILDFSKIEAGALRLESIPFNLMALLHSIENIFHYRAEEKRLAFEVKIGEGTSENLLGDPTRLTQILINLLSNAFKFTQEGGVLLEVTSVNEEKKVRVRFRIKDTGIGIPGDKLTQVFERFGQATSDTARLFGGTGLGLTISKQLIELQNGSIHVESEQGVGTTFSIEIPYQVSERVGEDPSLAVDRERVRHELTKDVSILIVEDNPLNRRIAELLFDDWGFQHEHTANGQAALELLQRKVFDIVLMDIQMPIMDGYTAAQKIRQELGLQVPIIATTAHAFPGEREKCMSYGMNDYISKPIREKELLALIKRYLPSGKQKLSRQEQLTNSTNKADFNHDDEYVRELSRGKPERIREMAELFLSQSIKELDLLEELVQSNNFGELAKVAHSMKSTVSYMGFEKPLGQLLKELELKAQADIINKTELNTLFSTIKLKTENARAFIQKKYL